MESFLVGVSFDGARGRGKERALEHPPHPQAEEERKVLKEAESFFELALCLPIHGR